MTPAMHMAAIELEERIQNAEFVEALFRWLCGTTDAARATEKRKAAKRTGTRNARVK